jgi:hypothetical protein
MCFSANAQKPYTQVLKTKGISAATGYEIDLMKDIAVEKFLRTANTKGSTLNNEISEWVMRLKERGKNSKYTYPSVLTKDHVSALFMDYNFVTESAADSIKKGVRIREDITETIFLVSMPAYNNYHRGFSFTTMNYMVHLRKIISYEEVEGDTRPVEKRPSYKRRFVFAEPKALNSNPWDE